MHSGKILNIPLVNIPLQNKLSEELNISAILAQILINRRISTPEDAGEFLNVDLNNLRDPYLFSDMRSAVDIIRQSVKNKEKIMIFGDYDADGVTSVALLKNTLSKMGCPASHYLPHRINEGYGLSKNIASIAAQNNIKLLITVDCGTSSNEQINDLRRQGVNVIVTDHHEPAQDCGDFSASALINPKVKESGYPYQDLAGVGVAYKLCQALRGDRLIDDLDLVSLGTIADVAPLTEENRIIAKFGLEQFSRTQKAGLKSLIETSRINNRKLNASFVSFILGPRINAGGRVASAETALKLLISEEKNEADELAKLIETYNRQRQKIESGIMEEAVCLIEKEVNFKYHRIIVIANEGWHQGVLGIIASKIADRFYRPTIIISLSEGLCKGSGRSIKNFHLFHALKECGAFLDNFGGHSHAVGLNIKRDNVDGFKARINEFAFEKLRLEDLLPVIEADMRLKLSDITEELINELDVLEPFGTANPEPLFYTSGLKLRAAPKILAKDTLKFWITDGTATCQAIGFGMAAEYDRMVNSDFFGLVYTPRIDSWQGNSGIILEVKDLILRF